MMVSQTMFPNETLQEQKLREYVNAAFERKAKVCDLLFPLLLKWGFSLIYLEIAK